MGLCVVTGYRKAYFCYDCAGGERSKFAERLLHVLQVPVNVEMVGIHSRNYGYFRRELMEGTVELVGFHHHGRGVAHQQVAVVVFRNPSQKCRAAFPTGCENMGEESAGGRFAVGAGYCKAALSVHSGEFSQYLSPFHQHVSAFPDSHKFLQIRRNRRGVNHECVLLVLRNQVRTVFIVDLNSLCFKFFREI